MAIGPIEALKSNGCQTMSRGEPSPEERTIFMQQKKTSEASPNKRLKEQRELRGWTQEDLAEKAGASPVTVSRWENGTLPSLYHRSKLCKIFRKTPHELGFIREAADDTSKKLAHQPLSSQEMATPASTRLPDNPANFQSLTDRKSTRLNSSHSQISYAVFCLKK